MVRPGGVYLNDVDLSEVNELDGTTSAVMCGFAKQGRIMQRVQIRNDKDFINEFGKPEVGNYFHYSVLGVLKGGGYVYVTRAEDDSEYGGLEIPSTGSPVALSGISDLTAFTFSLNGLFVVANYDRTGVKNTYIRIYDIDAVEYDFSIDVFTEDIDGNKILQETFRVSRVPNKIDGFGRNMFIEDYINSTSQYITVKNNSVPATSVMPVLVDVPALLAGGVSGTYPSGAGRTTALNNAYGLYANKEEVEVEVFCDAGEVVAGVATEILDICNTRKDCVAILSSPNDTAANVVIYRNSLGDLYDGAVYDGWLKITDKYNNKNVIVPASGYVAGAYLKTDKEFSPWFAVQGSRRGTLDVIGVDKIRSEADLNTLVNAQVNTIRELRGIGTVIMEQFTLQKKKSSTSSVNASRLLATLRRALKKIAINYVGEAIDSDLYTRGYSEFDDYLSFVKSNKGVYDYRIVCDSTNNTPTTIDNEIFNMDVYIKITRWAREIRITITRLATGVDINAV